MRVVAFIVSLLFVVIAEAQEHFLDFSKDELCKAEPHLAVCRPARSIAHSAPSLSADRLKELSEADKEGFIEETGTAADDPFDDISTRAPSSSSSSSHHRKHHHHRHHHHRSRNEKMRDQQNQYYRNYYKSQNSLLYRVYPSEHPKDDSYCPDMRSMFAYTCQPSKPLRLDLVEFCKDYASICNVPNFHRLPGPRMGPPAQDTGIGHVGVSGKFGFSVGAVPGLEVGAGWGVDVGPLPGMGESVGVDLGLNLGVAGAKPPEAYRRGMDNPNAAGGGVVGLSGGVGVKAPGTGPIGVGSGLGVGK